MDVNIVSALVWVKRGYAKKNPKEYEFLEEDIQQFKNDPLIKKNLNKELGQIEIEDNYDDIDEQGYNMPVFTSEIEQLKDQNDNQNPDLEKYPFGFEDISDEEKDDFQIKKKDALIIAAKIEKEFSSLEIYVYEEETSNLFVHHEITLSAFPLAIEWLSVDPKSFDAEIQTPGNYAIVGTFLPEIEIWNLDILNAIEPTIILGGEINISKKKVKKLKQKQQLSLDSHQDSVICLNLNTFRKNILASGSADQTVKLWDIQQRKSIHTYTNHKGKVQVVKWNQKEEAILLTGAYDKKLFLFDVRHPQNAMTCQLQSDVESAIWDPINPNNIIISCEDGYISQIDARKFNLEFLFHIKAHEKQTTSVSMSNSVSGMLATTSEDHTVKVWDTLSINNNKPLLVTKKTPNAGKLFCGAFYEDSPFIFACGNSKGELFVWDTSEDKNIVKAFETRVDSKIRPKIEECNNGQPQQKYQNQDDEDSDMEQEQI